MRVTPHILVVDDEPNLRKVLKTQLEKAGYSTTLAACGEEALDLIRSQDPDLILTDLRMPGMTGQELLQEVKQAFPEIPVVMLTAYATVEAAVEAMKRGAFDFLTKPFEKAAVLSVIHKALGQAERRRLEYQGPPDTDSDCGLIGEGAALERLRSLIRKVAPTPTTVLICGETGTGKELVAEAIHNLSPRHASPLIRINCGALPAELVEGELFGHEKGAFTGADRARPGRFELAHQGTLFLDEIGELPKSMQVKLLRVIQDGRIDRVGSTETRQVDVRLIAATNRDLEEAVRKDEFRQDLLYRLKVLEIAVPPLRDRMEDIPLLVQWFAKKHSRRLGREQLQIQPAALEELARHDWPGNIRELENLVERATLLNEGTLLRTFSMDHGPDESPTSPGVATDLKSRARAAAAEAERRLILAALDVTAGNVTHAAKRLSVSRRGLQLKMKELGIRPLDGGSA